VTTLAPVFPRAPRAAPTWPPKCGWSLLLVALLLTVPFFLKIFWPELIPTGLPVSDPAHVVATLFVVGLLVLIVALACLNLAWKHNIWRHGRIEPALLLSTQPDSFLDRLRDAPMSALISLLPAGGAINSSYTTICLLHFPKGTPKILRIKASVHNFSPTRVPRAVWIIFPCFWPGRPWLVADVAPREWVYLAAPDDLADALEMARAASKQHQR
jgi:hypothetical protein